MGFHNANANANGLFLFLFGDKSSASYTKQNLKISLKENESFEIQDASIISAMLKRINIYIRGTFYEYVSQYKMSVFQNRMAWLKEETDSSGIWSEAR